MGEELSNSNSREERILVSVRLRPLNEKELGRSDACDLEIVDNNTILFKNNPTERSNVPSSYNVDRVFGPQCPTKQVYEEAARDVILSVVSGINSTIFAYGQTSSGKTYTMSGITQYAVEDIYNYIEMHEEREFVLKFSALEIYNETMRDLLGEDNAPLRLLDDPEKGTVIDKLTEEILRDRDHLRELLTICEAQRKIGETSMNETSSRSHQILRLTIESSTRDYVRGRSARSLAATVNFVDLAGSERNSQTHSAGQRLKEGCHINRSLLTLGTVIRKLSKGRNGHIPYRDSKLTRILQNSLGGNARTAVICTVSLARIHIEQSRNTLFFACCAKEVTTNARVNEVVSDKELVKQLQRELAKLESDLKNMSPNSVVSNSVALMKEKELKEKELKEKELMIEQMEKEIQELKRQRDIAQSRVENMLRAVSEDQASTIDGNSTLGSPVQANHLDKSLGADASSEKVDAPRSNVFHNHQRHISQTSEDNFLLDGLTPKFDGPNPCQGWEEVANRIDTESEGSCKEVRCIGSESSRTDEESTVAAMKKKIEELQRTVNSLVNLSPSSSESNISGSRSFTWTRSRSCRATLTSSSFNSFKEGEQFTNTPPIGSEKDFLTLRLPSSNNSPNIEKHSRKNSDASTFSITMEPQDNKDPDVEEAVCTETREEPKRSRQTLHKSKNKAKITKLSRQDSNSTLLSFAMEEEEEEEEEEIKECYVVDASQNISGGSRDLQRHHLKSNIGSNIGQRHSRSSILSAPLVKEDSENSDSSDDTVSVVNSFAGRSRASRQRGTTQRSDIAGEESLPQRLRGRRQSAATEILGNSFQPNAACWPFEFERQRREIIELWAECYVPLVHRSHFFILFKGEQSDSVYLEVELRRLSFLKETFSLDNSRMKGSTTPTQASSLKALNREREMLSKQVHKKLSRKEREKLYEKWNISLKTKKRSEQLASMLWTNTRDIVHLNDSAQLIARLVGFVEPNQAPKEIFGLSFLPKPFTRKLFNW